MFKVGDKVRCVNNFQSVKLVTGNEYYIEGTRKNNVGVEQVKLVTDTRWYQAGRFVLAEEKEESAPSTITTSASSSKNKYSREIKPNVFADVYDVLRAFEVTDPCLSHLAKKALCAGLRGHKDRLEDLNDIKASVERAIEMHKEWSYNEQQY